MAANPPKPNPMIQTFGSVKVDRSGLFAANKDDDDDLFACEDIIPDSPSPKNNNKSVNLKTESKNAIKINPAAGVNTECQDESAPKFTILGKDIPLDPNQPELVLSTARIQQMVNLDIIGSNLQVLKLIANNVEKIEGLETLCNLRHLELYQNAIKRIENLEFCPKLEHLDLSFNRIRYLGYLDAGDPDRIDKKPVFADTLKKLYLPSNKLEEVPENALSCFKNLEILELGANRLREIPQDVIHLRKLKELWLGKNKITTMKVNGMTDDNMKDEHEHFLPDLEICSIQCNRLEHWEASFFENLCGPKLEQLYLSENNLPPFPISTPDGAESGSPFLFSDHYLPNLKTLDISQNKRINSIPKQFRLSELEELWMSGCGIDIDYHYSYKQDSEGDENARALTAATVVSPSGELLKKRKSPDDSGGVQLQPAIATPTITTPYQTTKQKQIELAANDERIAGLWNLKLKCLYLEHNPCYDANEKDGGWRYKEVMKKISGPSLHQLDAIVLELEHVFSPSTIEASDEGVLGNSSSGSLLGGEMQEPVTDEMLEKRQKLEEERQRKRFETIYGLRDDSVAGIRKIDTTYGV
ncbi:unnamed protein product [Amoebophrya sp. A120]|nr:unnamed protein product [Amoebophrya sp. A120]|eukprot:GSA120T00009891001.1